MKHSIIEIKAKSNNQDKLREILKAQKAEFKGIDHQVDTYFQVNHGRLKLREGDIENFLIHYHRDNQSGPKQSNITLYKSNPESSLKKILEDSLGILTIVDKQREIYYIDNVKFHIDSVSNLGNFVEIEAIDDSGEVSQVKLLEQCNHFMKLLDIDDKDLISVSYSDMILEKNKEKTITLGGSIKFREDIRNSINKLTELGFKALFPNIDYTSDGFDLSTEEKHKLAKEHFEAIDKADAVYFITKGGYIGTSCKLELGYAISKKKKIYFCEPTKDNALDSHVSKFIPLNKLEEFLKEI